MDLNGKKSLKEICGDIRKREIALYGIYEEVKAFLNTYHTLLHIKCVVTDHMEEVKLQPYRDWEIDTVLLEEADLQEILLVICESNEFGNLKLRLEHIGKKEYVDYISCMLVDSLLFNKRLVVCMGTQLIEQMCLLLSNSKEIADICSIQYFAESELLEAYKNRMQEYTHLCRFCDAYVRSSSEKGQFRLKVMKESELKPECKVVTISDYGFAGYFPQIDSDRNLYSEYMLRERLRLEMSYETLFFSRTDRELEELCKGKADMENMVAQILDSTFYQSSYVKEYFDEEVKRFKEKEAVDDIKLGEFIEQHKEKALCRNLNEWNEPVVSYVTERLLELLELPALTMGIDERERLIEDNSGSEILIYPSVRKALKMNENMQDKKYRVTTYYSTRYMTEKEYACYMAEYINKALELLQFCRYE